MYRYLVGVLAVCLLCSCASSPPHMAGTCAQYQTMPEPQPNTFAVAHDVQLGISLETKLHLEATQRTEDAGLRALLEDIGTTLLPFMPSYARTWRYRFYVTETADGQLVNASAGPGGVVIFSRGLLARIPTIDVLAVFLAHEMGHVARRSLTANDTELARVFARAQQPMAHRTDDPEGRDVIKALYPATVFLEEEVRTDVWAAHVAYRAGYDVASVATWFQENQRTRDSGKQDLSGRAHLFSCFSGKKPTEHHELTKRLEMARTHL